MPEGYFLTHAREICERFQLPEGELHDVVIGANGHVLCASFGTRTRDCMAGICLLNCDEALQHPVLGFADTRTWSGVALRVMGRK